MAKDYDNPTEQMKAISWQLKRIADQLEILNDNLIKKDQHHAPKNNSTSLREILNNFGT